MGLCFEAVTSLPVDLSLETRHRFSGEEVLCGGRLAGGTLCGGVSASTASSWQSGIKCTWGNLELAVDPLEITCIICHLFCPDELEVR